MYAKDIAKTAKSLEKCLRHAKQLMSQAEKIEYGAGIAPVIFNNLDMELEFPSGRVLRCQLVKTPQRKLGEDSYITGVARHFVCDWLEYCLEFDKALWQNGLDRAYCAMILMKIKYKEETAADGYAEPAKTTDIYFCRHNSALHKDESAYLNCEVFKQEIIHFYFNSDYMC